MSPARAPACSMDDWQSQLPSRTPVCYHCGRRMTTAQLTEHISRLREVADRNSCVISMLQPAFSCALRCAQTELTACNIKNSIRISGALSRCRPLHVHSFPQVGCGWRTRMRVRLLRLRSCSSRLAARCKFLTFTKRMVITNRAH